MLRAVYLDLDGTLLGRGASLLHDADGAFTDGLEPRDGKTIHEQIEESGAPALLLAHYAGRLEVFAPWQHGRDVSLLFLGEDISSEEADALLTEEGFGFLRLVDNGLMHGVPGDGRAYHLIPRAASKARAVARHMQARGSAPEDCIAVGDSREESHGAGVYEAVITTLAERRVSS